MPVIKYLPFEPCMHKLENGNRMGHMHMGAGCGATVKDDSGTVIGEVYADMGATVICKVEGENYHINALDLWKAVKSTLEETYGTER